MIAYYVHDSKKQDDLIILPEMECAVPVDKDRMEAFISVDPMFAQWSGDACGTVSPEDFGTVVATRDDNGDVCVVDQELWRSRMQYHLGTP
jgi:hypothetical protein